MGNCIFCEKPAGFLRKSHKECKHQHNLGKDEIMALVSTIGSNGGNLNELETKIEKTALNCFIENEGLQQLVIAGWEKAVEIAFDDGILTNEEENALIELKDHFSLTQNQVDGKGGFTKLIKGGVLREVLNGKLPERIEIDGNVPFNLQKTEKLVWVFQDVDYYEEKTRTKYVGGSQGVSVRIAKGLYYRVGAFKGERVQTSETIHADTGLLGVTNKHIYFAGTSKRFRIKYDKIVAFDPFSDGIGVQRDAVTAKPQTFVTGDGWFTYNLITNLAQL